MILPHDLASHQVFMEILGRLRSPSLVIDVGAGVRPFPVIGPARRIEPHGEYADILLRNRYEVMPGTALERLPETPKTATVLMLDVLEHMNREEGLKVLEIVMERDQAVVVTPLGFLPQSGPDPWGYNGEQWQTHRSGWGRGDFPEWTCATWPDGDHEMLCAYRS